jgi:hypothetical protein
MAMPTSCLGERGRVVDAVADHRDLPALALELRDLGRLIGGKHLGDHLVDTKLGGDAFGGRAAVTGEHDRPDAERFERGDRLGGRLARGIGDGDDGRGLAVEGDLDAGAALAGEFVRAGGEAVTGDAFALQQPGVADGEPAAVDGREQSVAGHGLEAVGARHLQPARGRCADDRLGEGMF